MEHICGSVCLQMSRIPLVRPGQVYKQLFGCLQVTRIFLYFTHKILHMFVHGITDVVNSTSSLETLLVLPDKLLFESYISISEYHMTKTTAHSSTRMWVQVCWLLPRKTSWCSGSRRCTHCWSRARVGLFWTCRWSLGDGTTLLCSSLCCWCVPYICVFVFVCLYWVCVG